MKNKARFAVLIAGLIACVAGTAFYWKSIVPSRSLPAEQTVRSSGQGSDVREFRTDRIQKDGVLKKFRDARLNNYFEGKQTLLDVAAFEGYLSANKRNPKSLLAVYWLTKDKDILTELKRHAEEPNVALSLALMDGDLGFDEQIKCVKTYIARNPGEMQGYMLAAKILAKNGSLEDAVAMMDKALSADVVTIGDSVVSSEMKSALLSSGMDEKDARMHMAINERPVRKMLLNGMDMIGDISKVELANANGHEEKNAIVSKYVNAALSLKELSSYIDDDLLMYYQIRMRRLLTMVPEEAELNNGLGKVKDLAENFRREERILGENRKYFNLLLKNATPDQVDTFFQQREKMGDPEGQKWFIEQYGK